MDYIRSPISDNHSQSESPTSTIRDRIEDIDEHIPGGKDLSRSAFAVDPFATTYRSPAVASLPGGRIKRNAPQKTQTGISSKVTPQKVETSSGANRLISPLFGTRSSRYHLYSRPAIPEVIFHQSWDAFEAISAIQYDSATSHLITTGGITKTVTSSLNTVTDYFQPKSSKELQGKPGAMMARFEVDKFLRLVGIMSFNPISGSPRNVSAQFNYMRMWCIAMVNWVMAARALTALAWRNDEFLFYTGDFTRFFTEGSHIFYSFPLFMFALQGALTFQVFLNEEMAVRNMIHSGGSIGTKGGKFGTVGVKGSKTLPWMEIFEVARGHLPPRDLQLDGANGERYIRKVSRTFRFVQQVCLLSIILSIVWVCQLYWDNLHGVDYYLIGLPWSILSAFWFLHMTAHTLTNAALFYLLCFYLWVRLTQFNGKMMRAYGPIVYPDRHGTAKSAEFALMEGAITDFDQICSLIKRLDAFWAPMLTAIYFLFTPSICFMLYLVMFTSPDLYTLGIIIMSILLSIGVLSYYLLPPAVVNLLAHKHYVQLNSMNSKAIPVSIKTNMLTMLERMGNNPIGITCGELFVVTMSSFMHSLLAIGTYFLLIVDFAQSKQRLNEKNAQEAAKKAAELAAAAARFQAEAQIGTFMQ